MAISGSRTTRLGKSGYMTEPYGSFAGKTSTEAVEGNHERGFTANVGRLLGNK